MNTNNNYNLQNNMKNNYNTRPTSNNNDLEWSPKNITIILTIWSSLTTILAIVAAAIPWSNYNDYNYNYYSGEYEYFDIGIKPGKYILALIIISIILSFFYSVVLVTAYNNKLVKYLKPLVINFFLLFTVVLQVIVIICAFADKDEYFEISLALGNQKKPKEGTIIFIICTSLNVLLFISSCIYVKNCLPGFVNQSPNVPMNNFNGSSQLNPQFNSQFTPQFTPQLNNQNTQEVQYIQHLEQYIQQLHQYQNPQLASQIPNVQSSLQQTIDQISNYLGQLRNFQVQLNNNLKSMTTSIQNNTSTISSLAVQQQV